MAYLPVLMSLLLSAPPLLTQAQDLGNYIGNVQTEWLEDGRRMRLLSPFAYFDPNGVEWNAPTGWVA